MRRWYADAFMQAQPEAVGARIKQVLDTPADVSNAAVQSLIP